MAEAHSRALWKLREALLSWNEAERARMGSIFEERMGSIFEVNRPLRDLLPDLAEPKSDLGAARLLDALGYAGESDDAPDH